MRGGCVRCSCPSCCLRGGCVRCSCPRGGCLRGGCIRCSRTRGGCLRGGCVRCSCLRGGCLRGSCLRCSRTRGGCLRGGHSGGSTGCSCSGYRKKVQSVQPFNTRRHIKMLLDIKRVPNICLLFWCRY